MTRARLPDEAIEFVSSAYARGETPVEGVPEAIAAPWSWRQTEVAACAPH